MGDSGLKWIAFLTALIAFTISIGILAFAEPTDALREQAFNWFVLALLSAVIPWVKQLKIFGNAIEFREAIDKLTQTSQEIKTELKNLSNLKLANEVFVFDPQGSLALIRHPKHGVRIPCGGRLLPAEEVHLSVERVIRDELGLERNEYRLWPIDRSEFFEKVEVVPRPYQVQVERRDQREDEEGRIVNVHYDFIFVAITYSVRPPFRSNWSEYDPRWYSQESMEEELAKSTAAAPFTFPDVAPTYRKILAELELA